MIKKIIKDKIKNKIKIHFIKIEDLTKTHLNHPNYDGGGHYKLIVISDDFINCTLIQRHQMIYDILKKMIKKEIHAISITAKTIDEYNKKENS